MEFDSQTTNARAAIVLEVFAGLYMAFVKIEIPYTFRRRNLWSVVDLTYVTIALASRGGLQVNEDYT